MKRDFNNEPDIDTLADEVSQALNGVEELISGCPHEGVTRDLNMVFENQAYRQALVRLYSVLLEVDMRNNPEAYLSEE